VSLQEIKELLDKYDKLRSVANSGSSDQSLTSRFKILRRIYEFKLLRNFSINIYAVPFASNKIRNEIRSTLINISALCKINYLRTGRSDQSSKEANEIIKEYLDGIPKRGLPLADKLENNSWNILGAVIGIISLMLSSWSTVIQFVLMLIGLGLLVPLASGYLIYSVIRYFDERRWHKKWMKKLAIEDLKHKLINELVELNDNTYTELDTKFK